MDGKLILAIDCGTQSVRAMLFDDKGELKGKTKETFEPYFSKEDGYAEQHFSVYYDAVCQATNKLKTLKPELWDSVYGVVVSTMRDVGICLGEDMKPLRPCVLWLDRRKAGCEKPLPLKNRFLFAVSGMAETVDKTRRETISNWIQENEKDIWAKTKKYVQFSAYMNYNLTGELKDGIASTIGHIPINYKARKWMDQKHMQMCVFNIPDSMMYPLVEPGEIIGRITKKCAEDTGIKEGLPLIASGSDKGSETLGGGVIGPGKASISFGTTATIQISTKDYVEPITFLPAYPAVVKGYYNPEIMVNRGYWMLTWFCKEFMKKNVDDDTIYEHILDRAMTTLPACSDGLFVEPYWSPGLKRTEARGAVIGFTDRHSKEHIYKAIIEGIDFSLREGLMSLEKKSKTKVTELRVGGGGAQSDIVCKLTASLFGLPVKRVQTYETTGLGAAIAGFVGMGRFKTYEEAVESMVHVSAEFKPDAKDFAIYDDFFKKVYLCAYGDLKPTFIRMRKFSDKK